MRMSLAEMKRRFYILIYFMFIVDKNINCSHSCIHKFWIVRMVICRSKYEILYTFFNSGYWIDEAGYFGILNNIFLFTV